VRLKFSKIRFYFLFYFTCILRPFIKNVRTKSQKTDPLLLVCKMFILPQFSLSLRIYLYHNFQKIGIFCNKNFGRPPLNTPLSCLKNFRTESSRDRNRPYRPAPVTSRVSLPVGSRFFGQKLVRNVKLLFCFSKKNFFFIVTQIN